MKRKFFILLIVIISCSIGIRGQNSVTITTRLDSTHILIGDQINVHVSIQTPPKTLFIAPQITQELLEPVEMVDFTKFDTVITGDKVTYHQTVTITAFDSGRYFFPALSVLSYDSSVLAVSNVLFFDVSTIPVDTTAAIRDIKSLMKVPLTFAEILPFLIITVVIAAVLALVVWLILKYRKKQKPQNKKVKLKPREKPHIVALRNLEKLKEKKLWQSGKVKQYYSELTDIIRIYIDGRYGVNAMEMVSSDIIDMLDSKQLPKEMHILLYDIFSVADLVKFAKWQPLPHDHDLCFSNAMEFVQKTAEKEDTTNKNQETNK